MPGYQSSFYSETLSEALTPDPLEPDQSVDVCIVGGGIAALSCAQELLEAGYKVVLLETKKVFSGASGLNGGFVSPGYALSTSDIETKVGTEATKELFKLTVKGTEKIDQNIETFNISSACQTQGKILLLRYPPSKNERQHAEEMREKFNYEITPVDEMWLRNTLSSTTYKYGFLHQNGFHMHPLNYGIALARNLQRKGLKIVEGERVLSIKPQGNQYQITSTSGRTIANHVVVCTGGYASGEVKRIKNSILPITTYVAVSEPDETLPNQHIRTNYGLGDNRRASDYYRIVNHNQLLWGGRITAFPTESTHTIADYIKRDILKSYPTIKKLRIKTAWSGIMGYAMHKMPYIGRFDDGIWYCTAFGGRGLGAGTAGGKVVADAILGHNKNINLFQPFTMRSTFGLLGRIGVEATYKKYIITDHIKEFRKRQ